MFGPEEAPWLIICHGMALNHREFLPFAEKASREWRMLLWDMPGHGESERPVDYSVERMADALEAVLDAERIASAAVLGFSFGGVVAQELLRRRPTLVFAFVAYACFAPYLLPQPVKLSQVRPVVWVRFGWRRWDTLRRLFARLCANSPEGREIIETEMAPVGKRGFLAMTGALLRAGPPDSAFRVDCPLLLVCGSEDSNGAALEAATEALARSAENAARVVIPNAGHCAHLDQPLEFGKAVLAFLNGARRPA